MAYSSTAEAKRKELKAQLEELANHGVILTTYDGSDSAVIDQDALERTLQTLAAGILECFPPLEGERIPL